MEYGADAVDCVQLWPSQPTGARNNAVDGGDRAIGLAVGAGGPTGGPFIDAVLDVLAERIGWAPASATSIVGTSAGAFVASRVGQPEAVDPRALEQLIELNNISEWKASLATKLMRGVRAAGGRTVALLAPHERDQALYDVAPPPYHPGARVVTVEHTWGTRHAHNLSEHEDSATAMVQASAAIPYKNGPIEIDGRLHADGAVHSANNVDLLDPAVCPVIVVVSPMIPASGGSTVSKFHRAQLVEELRPWHETGRAAVVIMPNEDEHANRRDREFFRSAGTNAAERLFS